MEGCGFHSEKKKQKKQKKKHGMNGEKRKERERKREKERERERMFSWCLIAGYTLQCSATQTHNYSI